MHARPQLPPALRPTPPASRARGVRMLAGIAALALTAAACGSANEGTSGSGAADTNATLNVVSGHTPNQFDPCGGANGSETGYMTSLYAPLIRADPATGDLSPGIAKSWKASDGGHTLTLTLRSGLTFQDGTTLDADAVVKSVKQCLKLGNQAIPELKGLTAKGDAVIFRLKHPSAGLPGLLSGRIGLIASPTAREKSGSSYGSRPAGAGPYKLAKFVPGSSVRLERWSGYKPAGPPAAKAAAIQVSIIRDPSAEVAALTGGQADYGYGLDNTAKKSLAGSGITVDTKTGIGFADLNVDRSQGPLKDVKVRQAISYALDRKALARAATSGLSDAAALQPYPPGHPDHEAELDKSHAYNPAKARQLLAQAGHPHGLTLRGVSLDADKFVNNGVLVAGQLAKVGIKVKFDAKAVPDASKSFYFDHDYDLFSTGQNSGPDWVSSYRRLLSADSNGNAGHTPVPGGEAALARLDRADTPAKLKDALHQANLVYQKQLPVIPLFFSPIVRAWTNRVVGAKKAFAINGEVDFTALGVKK